ncbi:UNVERIFIED_CONTAM: hypothetical protein FKN15_039293, partial [Acipenser sinensis]
KSDKEMSKKERGNHDQVTSRDGKLVLVKWFDNCSVLLASNIVGVGEEDEVERWDKKEKRYMKIKRPQIVKNYNEAMGGVDKLDQLISLYNTEIKSWKWMLWMFTHGFDVAVVNSWLEYKRDAQHSGIPNKEVLDLLHFRMNVAECLLRLGKPKALKKRGRPSIPSTLTPLEEPPLKQGTIERRPLPEVQKDMVDHMPNFDEKKEATRCKQPFCTGKTHVFCDK